MNYHPDIELLLKYTSGKVAPALSIIIGLHHHSCRECQKKISELESIGGNTLESIEVESIEVESMGVDEQFDKLMQDIEYLSDSNESSAFDECAIAQIDLDIVNTIYNKQFQTFDWKRLTSKIFKAEIDLQDEGMTIELLRFAPNAKIPKHTHQGEEFTLVLDGSFRDSMGEYREGEFVVQDQTTEHQPIAGKDGCICLAVTNAPLKFTGVAGPLINWFIRQ
ncbi:ChrR family anti-sigma-E factor [Aliikangiella sp. G2MR2-5]|uniref:ChrR family anti-sigma-E factor n=1 Tax=Aliikangiella sp. G2MR2-5 TaxID=2788943 RepID=UPI0018AA1474|nr:ChrR family anti-sigma-E factor [Aliikangiella sp. G2MR2-5]